MRSLMSKLGLHRGFYRTLRTVREFGQAFREEAAGHIRVLVPFTATVYAIKFGVADFTMCDGPSMVPTLTSHGDQVFVRKLMYTPAVGDVVILKSPKDPKERLCKRIIAKEGQRVYRATVFGQPEVITVPQGHVWVQGDNLSNSMDSRSYGPVPEALIEGRAVYRIFPHPKRLVPTLEHSGQTELARQRSAMDERDLAELLARPTLSPTLSPSPSYPSGLSPSPRHAGEGESDGVVVGVFDSGDWAGLFRALREAETERDIKQRLEASLPHMVEWDQQQDQQRDHRDQHQPQLSAWDRPTNDPVSAVAAPTAGSERDVYAPPVSRLGTGTGTGDSRSGTGVRVELHRFEPAPQDRTIGPGK